MIKKGYKQTEDHKKRRAESRIKNAVLRTGMNYLERRKKFTFDNVELRILNGMRARSKNRFPFDITITRFREFLNTIPKICSYCDTEISIRNPVRKNTLSIDRKYNEVGYVEGNICIACYRCNTIKGDTLTYDEMREIAQKYLKNKAV